MPEYQFTVTETTQHTVITTRATLEEAKDAYLEGTARSVDYAVTERTWTDITADGRAIDDTADPDAGHPDHQDMEYQQFLRDQAEG
ncbi:hypothetical protein [Isoptericola sp. NPDC056605]|uniref:hypothetical protein n=1 Tax=Isoptericola sp. NPDC056605 TaxID=3345876 RepID=UPI0036912D2C